MPDAFDSFGTSHREISEGASDTFRQSTDGTAATADTDGNHGPGSSRRAEKRPEQVGNENERRMGGETSSGGHGEWRYEPYLVDQVSGYQRGETSRTQAVLKGTAHIEALVGATQQFRDNLLAGYLGAFRGDGGIERERGGDHGEEGGRSEGLSALLAEAIKHGGPRGGGEAEENRGWEDGEGSNGETSRGQKRLREEDFPWFEDTKHFNDTHLSESSRKTREILEQARRDISLVQSWVQLAHGAPANFPSSEWTNILRGKAVNLDSVFTNVHIAQPVSENVGNVGGLPIRVVSSEPAKKIRTAGEWFSAWFRAAQATGLVFPHRRSELFEYGERIIELFRASLPEQHGRILLYDKAVRGTVGGGETILLTDETAYRNLYTAIMLPGGIETGRPTKRRASGPSDEVCRRFNSRKGCPDAPCRYRHICSRCGDSRHGGESCTQRNGPRQD